MEYTYPIDVDWSQEEMVAVVSFFNAIESYYESQIERDTLMTRYREFKQVVPGKADEKISSMILKSRVATTVIKSFKKRNNILIKKL